MSEEHDDAALVLKQHLKRLGGAFLVVVTVMEDGNYSVDGVGNGKDVHEKEAEFFKKQLVTFIEVRNQLMMAERHAANANN